MAMMAITTSSSINVKPRRPGSEPCEGRGSNVFTCCSWSRRGGRIFSLSYPTAPLVELWCVKTARRDGRRPVGAEFADVKVVKPDSVGRLRRGALEHIDAYIAKSGGRTQEGIKLVVRAVIAAGEQEPRRIIGAVLRQATGIGAGDGGEQVGALRPVIL